MTTPNVNVVNFARMVATLTLEECKNNAARGMALAQVDIETLVQNAVSQLIVKESKDRVQEVVYDQESEFLKNEAESYDEFYARTEKLLLSMIAVSDSLLEGEIVNGVIAFQIADGQAYYRVRSESPLVLEHLNYGDGYEAADATINGVTPEYIRESLASDRRIRSFKPN